MPARTGARPRSPTPKAKPKPAAATRALITVLAFAAAAASASACAPRAHDAHDSPESIDDAAATTRADSQPGEHAQRDAHDDDMGDADDADAPIPAALLPREAGLFAPAFTALREGAAPADAAQRAAALTDDAACARCHADVAAQWRGSAHAFASMSNPVYRVSFERFRADAGTRASRFCGGCHDPALLLAGFLDDDDAFAQLAPDDPRAHAGVSCALCHGIAATTADGNGSYALRTEPIPLPRDGDDASLARHRAAVSTKRQGNDVCVPCHRSFLDRATGHPFHLVGMDDVADWQNSAYTKNGIGRVDDKLPVQNCIDCHMQRTRAPRGDVAARDGTVASHAFTGGHTWLAAMRRDREGLARGRDFLRGVASVALAAQLASASSPATPSADGDDALLIDVSVRNLDVGHRFPGGVRDAQDVWLELEARDARGAIIAHAGRAHATDPDDSEAHVLRARVVDERGVALWAREIHDFRTPLVDHTVAARDVAVVRYRLALAGLDADAYPLVLRAELRHRTRNLVLQNAACRASRQPRERAFQRASRALRGAALDPCAPQPLTVIAAAEIAFAGDSRDDVDRSGERVNARPGAGDQARAAWRAPYERGLGWLHATQEHLENARPILLAALAAAPSADQHAHAAIADALGRLAGKQGRTDEALRWLEAAEMHNQRSHPAISSARGNALARVWRWHEAQAAFADAAAQVSRNYLAQAAWAQSLGSLGLHRRALAAAQQGLRLLPRNPALLRVQAISLAALGSPDAARALAAYERFRDPDTRSDMHFACTAREAACAREVVPVHEHRMKRVSLPRPALSSAHDDAASP